MLDHTFLMTCRCCCIWWYMSSRLVRQIFPTQTIVFCFIYYYAVVGQTQTCTSGIVTSENWQYEDAQDYLLVANTSSEFGYQVLIPGIRFNCHGFIQSWSALTVLNNFQATALFYLAHHLYFQLGRPTEKGRYKLIDDDHLVFEEPELIGNIYHFISSPRI